MNRLKVSVILLSYNYCRYLDTALCSLVCQTYCDYEIVAVDDGSTDGSLELLLEWQKRYPQKLRVITHPGRGHCGIVATYRLGIEKARGEWVAFLEADDRWHPQNLQKKIEAGERFPEVGVVYSDYRPFGEFRATFYWHIYALANRLSTRPHRPFRATRPLLLRNPVASFSHFIVRRDLLDVIPWDVPPLASRSFDWWVLAHCSLYTHFYFVPEHLCDWRIHKGSAGYGRVTLKTLWRLHRFLMILYASLERTLKTAGNIQNSEICQSLDRGLAFQNILERRQFERLVLKILRHPIMTLRFLSYVMLKNFLVGAS